jgi:hypothetical protein
VNWILLIQDRLLAEFLKTVMNRWFHKGRLFHDLLSITDLTPQSIRIIL